MIFLPTRCAVYLALSAQAKVVLEQVAESCVVVPSCPVAPYPGWSTAGEMPPREVILQMC